ncbi:MAG: ribonuclease J [Eubacteriales bacterium]
MAKKLKIIPLGGVDEIGKNCTVIEYGKNMIVVDLGMTFPDEEMLGIDVVIPDITYLEDNKDKIKALIITHGHEDHIGAIPYYIQSLKVPVYGTELTIGLIESKLKEHRIDNVSLNIIKPRQKFKIDCFEIEPIQVSHSIQGSVAFAIDTPVGKIIHTGDFKVDFTPIDGQLIDLHRFACLGEEGVLLMLADSTNVERPGYTESESTVGGSLEEIFHEAKGRIIVSTFSSNIHRLQQIVDNAELFGRKVCFTGRSMLRISEVATSINQLKINPQNVIDISQINNYTPEKLTIITTGSQGENMSGLVRMATGIHSHISVLPGDTVVMSASPIPGNEKLVYRLINQLFKKGADVKYGSLEDIHTSGHACQEELKLIHSLVKPKFFMPVHGEYRHLKLHGQLAQKMGMDSQNIMIPEMGRAYSVTEDSIKASETVPNGGVLVDGLGIGDVGEVVLRDRKHLSQDGLIIVVLTISKSEGVLVAGPDIISRGFVYMKESEKLIDDMRDLVQKIIDNASLKEMMQWQDMKSKIRKELRRFLYNRIGRKPMILPIFMEI